MSKKDDYKMRAAIIFLILSPFIGLAIALVIVEISH